MRSSGEPDPYGVWLFYPIEETQLENYPPPHLRFASVRPPPFFALQKWDDTLTPIF